MNKSVAIINYNTPELTEAAIRSLRRQCAERYPVYVFDNSDRRPFTKRLSGVSVFDNTSAQLVDFEAELAKFPDRCFSLASASNFGSMKHCMSVQKLFELLPDGFILLESDVILRKDIGFIWDERYAAVGTIQKKPRGNFYGIDRLLPYLCYLNVPLLTRYGARYYDPARCWMLQAGEFTRGNWYDTGASILEDIVKTKPALVCLNYPSLPNRYLHYAAGSWRRSDLNQQLAWIEKNRGLLSDEREVEADTAEKNGEARIYICTHKDFPQRVTSPVYEVLDARTEGDVAENGIKGAFYSEILVLHRLASRKTLPKTVGTCGYRKYWSWMDDVPDLSALVAAHGCVVSQRVKLGTSMLQHYARMTNVEDLDILTRIIERRNKAFAPIWHKALESNMLHPASLFILQAKDFRRMMKVVWNLIEEYLKVTGTDIDRRLSENAKAYRLDKTPRSYQYRIGGQLGERIISAWIDWQFPEALEVSVKTYAQG